jgi:hypothetical protein
VIAVDTSVMVELLGDGPKADAAGAAVRQGLGHDAVVVCEVVVSELVAGLGRSAEIIETLEELGVAYSALEYRSALRAGEMQRRYNERRRLQRLVQPAPWRTVPDFLIGSHALLQCQGLITFDVGFYRDYFKGLKIVVPKG